MKKLLFIVPLLLFGTACKKDSSEIDQAKIFQNYSMTYDEDTDKTTVYAYFYEEKLGGKNLELTGSSTITMNGTGMTKSGTSYSTTVDGNLATATLVFTDNDGKSYTNTISKLSYIANPSSAYLNNGISADWYWSGNAIGNDEYVTLTFTNMANTSITATFTETDLGAYYLTMSANSLSVLPDGNTKAEIKRVKTSTVGNFAAVGGKITATYMPLYNYVEVY